MLRHWTLCLSRLCWLCSLLVTRCSWRQGRDETVESGKPSCLKRPTWWDVKEVTPKVAGQLKKEVGSGKKGAAHNSTVNIIGFKRWENKSRPGSQGPSTWHPLVAAHGLTGLQSPPPPRFHATCLILLPLPEGLSQERTRPKGNKQHTGLHNWILSWVKTHSQGWPCQWHARSVEFRVTEKVLVLTKLHFL